MGRAWLTAEDPRRIGPYWPSSRLGSGGQGVVYEAYDGAGRRCAVKILRGDTAADSGARNRFDKEVRAARSVPSFCTAPILAADTQAEPPYIVSEFVDGRDVAAAVRDTGPFAGEALIRLATGVATALVAIHTAGVLHRDLKPGNVLLGPDGPRVIDFGIARTRDMTLTAPGAMMGTPGYMAPEVLGGRPADDKSDVFAWGAVVLFAATGRDPFHGENIGELVVRVTEHHPDLSALAEPLRSLVGAALSKDPQDRPTAARLLMGLLGAGLPGELPNRQDRAEPREGQAELPEGQAQLPEARAELLAAGVRGSAHVRDPGDTVAATTPALGSLAEAAFAALSPAVQDVAQQVLLRLVVPGDAADGSQDGVRTAAFTELTEGLAPLEVAAVRQVVDAFTEDEVLLTDDEGGVRPVSAALLRAWPRLQGWVETHRAELRTARDVGEAARAWDRSGRSKDDLLRGHTLHAARAWAAAAPPFLRLSSVERAFLDAGGLQEHARRRQQRRVRASLAVALVLALAAGTVAWRLQRANTEQENRAIAADVAAAAESMRRSDPELAMLLSAAAWRIGPADEARSALLTSMNQRERDGFRDPTTAPADSAELATVYRYLSEDGRILLSIPPGPEPGSDRKTVRVQRFDVKAGKRLTDRHAPANQQIPTAVSPDAAYVAYDDTVRDLRTGKRVGEPVEGEIQSVSQGGRRAVSVSEDDELFVTDLRTGRVLHHEHVDTSEVLPQLSGDGSTALWCGHRHPVVLDLDTGSKKTLAPADEEESCQDEGSVLALSRDGSRVAMNALSTQVWDATAKSGRVLSSSPAASDLEQEDADLGMEEVSALRFSPDGRVLVLTSGERVVAVRSTDVTESVADADAVAPNDTDVPAAVDPDARVLRFVADNRVRTLALGPVLDVPRTRKPAAKSALSPDARTVTRLEEQSAGSTRVRTWRLPDSGRRGTAGARPFADVAGIFIRGEGIDWIAHRPDGAEFATVNPRGDIAVHHARTGKRRYVLPGTGTQGWTGGLAYGTDGRSLAVGIGSNVVIWDSVERKKERVLKNVAGTALALGGKGDDRVLVTSEGDRVDVATGKVTRNALGEGEVADVEFSPDGKTLAVSQDGRVTLWNGSATTRVGVMGSTSTDVATAQRPEVTGLRFSADGQQLAGVAGRESYHLWSVPSRKSIGGVQPGIEDRLTGLAFDDDGRLHLSGARVPDHVVDTDPDRMIRTLCKRVDRAPELTRKEWKQNVRGAPYRTVCPT